MLTEVISNMTSSLQKLNLSWNGFSSVNFEKLVTKIAECSVCSTLQELILDWSTNFDSDKSVRKFAEILAIAPVLKKCNIVDSSVKVEVQYATVGIKGSLVIWKIDEDGQIIGEQEIFRRETDKVED